MGALPGSNAIDEVRRRGFANSKALMTDLRADEDFKADRHIRRVFIWRPDNLGDLVLFSAFLKHIRKRWPSAEITLCVRGFGLELFANCPHVDNLVSNDQMLMDFFGEGRLSWMPRIRGCDRVGKFLRSFPHRIVHRAYKSDLAILPNVSPAYEDHLSMKMIPARYKIGVCGNHNAQSAQVDLESRSIYSAQMDAADLPPDFSEIEATRLFLKFMDIDARRSELWPEFWTTGQEYKRAVGLVLKKTDTLTLGIAPGYSNGVKRLPPEWFAAVVNLLRWNNIQIVIFGNGSDVDVCDGVAKVIENSANGISVTNLTGQTSVLELVECIKRCDLMLSQDNAALHIATALKVPVVGIIGGGHYGRFYPWGDPNLSRPLSKTMDCYHCNWQCRFESIKCIQELSPADAAISLNDLYTHVFRVKQNQVEVL